MYLLSVYQVWKLSSLKMIGVQFCPQDVKHPVQLSRFASGYRQSSQRTNNKYLMKSLHCVSLRKTAACAVNGVGLGPFDSLEFQSYDFVEIAHIKPLYGVERLHKRLNCNKNLR